MFWCKKKYLNLKYFIGGYIYFETSYKMIDRIFSSAGLESFQTSIINTPIKSEYQVEKNSWKPEDKKSNQSLNREFMFKQTFSKESHNNDIPNHAYFLSPNISKTGPVGHCINFYYNIDGLSADKLRILVRDPKTKTNQTLWESRVHTDSKWVKAEIVYTYETYHQVNYLRILNNCLIKLFYKKLFSIIINIYKLA